MQPVIFTLLHRRPAAALFARRGVPPSLIGQFPGPNPPSPPLNIVGISRDASGNPLAGCTCTLFRVSSGPGAPIYTQLQTTVSDGSGNYQFQVGIDGPYRVTFDLGGSPIRAGLTVNTLAGVP